MMLKYIELKSGFNDDGPAWIGRVAVAKSGRTIYFNGKAFKRATGGGFGGNYIDLETRDTYWISGVKKSGLDRHWAGSGKISVTACRPVIASTELRVTNFAPPADRIGWMSMPSAIRRRITSSALKAAILPEIPKSTMDMGCRPCRLAPAFSRLRGRRRDHHPVAYSGGLAALLLFPLVFTHFVG